MIHLERLKGECTAQVSYVYTATSIFIMDITVIYTAILIHLCFYENYVLSKLLGFQFHLRISSQYHHSLTF